MDWTYRVLSYSVLVFDTSDESGSVPDEDCCMLRPACTAAASAGLPYDALMALCGVSAPNACTGYAPLPMPDAAFEEDFVYDAETGNYPAANITIAGVTACCGWLAARDDPHTCRLPAIDCLTA